MSIKDYLERKTIFLDLAKRKATGAPVELANRFNVSIRSLYRFIENLRSEGFDISYCRKRDSYYLTHKD